MAYNSNYGFNYPGGEDTYNVEDFNENFSKTGNALDSIKTSLAGKAGTGHTHELSSTSLKGTLPINKGGTGAVTAAAARSNLGLGSAATRGSTGIVYKDEDSLVTSGGVYSYSVNVLQKKTCYLVAVRNVSGGSAGDCDISYINAADFVVDCTNSSDGFVSMGGQNGLNSFLASLPAGSKVVFAPGSYLIADTIQADTRLYLEGLNHRATFFMKNDSPMLNIGNGTDQANNVTVRNLYFRKWDYTDMPPTEGTKSNRTFSTPIITVTNGNGVYIEKCGLYNRSPVYSSSRGYNSLIKYNGYASNSVVEKCVLNTTVHFLTNNDTVVGFTIDMSGCNSNNSSSLKFIANFGSITCFKPKAISSYETTFIGCTGVKEYNEDNIAVNALSEEVVLNDSTDI